MLKSKLTVLWDWIARINQHVSPLWHRLYPETTASDYRFTRWLFLRVLGVIYFIAFLSFAFQALGLIGSNGILPVKDIFPVVTERFTGIDQFLRFPTILWLNSSNTAINLMNAVGIVCSILLILRVAPAAMTFLCWFLYLSVVTAGQQFMSFQWDILLLETGFLAIFLAPWNIRPSIISEEEPPRLVIWMFRWLLFRLMFASGMVKLLSGDASWHGLTAMTYHYETQPIPNPVAWFMYHLPYGFHQFETLATLFIELAIPPLFFAPRRLRFVAGGFTILLQHLILLTGNYTYFNMLTIALCLLLFDDKALRRVIPSFVFKRLELSMPLSRFRHIGLTLAVAFVGLLSIVQFGRQILRIQFSTDVIDSISRVAPMRFVNTYGLFAVMTTERPQIIIQGSNDGEEWKTYDLPYQPENLTDMPFIVEPHQPRLDWQLWFAALGDYRNNRWFVNFMRKLLEGSPDVLSLLSSNPFPDAPPEFIRAQRYDYTFSDWDTLNRTGEWWQREFRDEYFPAVSLEQFQN